jgi:hypothetical protein
MTHVSGPDFLSIQVRDLQRSAGFYQRELGLRPMAGSPPSVVAFQTSPIPFGRTFVFQDPDGYAIAIHGAAQD